MRNLLLISLLLLPLTCFSKGLESGNYILRMDSRLNGQLDKQARYRPRTHEMAVQVKDDRLIAKYTRIDGKATQSDSKFRGRILTAQHPQATTRLVQITQQGRGLWRVLHAREHGDVYRGTWFDALGNSGDFEWFRSR